MELAGCVPAGSALAYLDTPDQAAARLVWGGAVPDGWSAFELGTEKLAVIVNPANPAQSISSAGLTLVFSGEILDWDYLGQAPGPLTAWSLPAADESASVALAGGIVLASGDQLRLAPAPAELRAAVAADPSAIGLLPARFLDDSVRELVIDGLDPAALSAPLLALTPQEPQGALRAWLGCLQAKLAP